VAERTPSVRPIVAAAVAGSGLDVVDGARVDGEQVGAERVDAGEEVGLAGAGDTQDGDEGRDADGDAQDGQAGADAAGAQPDGADREQVARS
jgi:hypothetical protein